MQRGRANGRHRVAGTGPNRATLELARKAEHLGVTGYGTTAVWRSAPVETTVADCILHPPFRAAQWLREMVERKAAPEEIADAVFQRVMSGQSDLHEAQRILNDIGGRPGGGEAVKRLVTQKNIARLGSRR